MRGQFAMPVLCGGLLMAAGAITALIPFSTGGATCDGDALQVARRTAAVVTHDADCTRSARHELAFSGGLIVVGLAAGVVTTRIAAHD